MKRRDLIRHLQKNDCVLIREGSNHSIYASRQTGTVATVPRHREIKKLTVASICQQLGISLP
jgi:predicted RNA binding protein YcfA (HicA-like mRNA interferase family)